MRPKCNSPTYIGRCATGAGIAIVTFASRLIAVVAWHSAVDARIIGNGLWLIAVNPF